MNHYRLRDVVDFYLPLTEDIANTALSRPDNVILNYAPDVHSVDIGALCYLDRIRGTRGKENLKGRNWHVNIESFDASRIQDVKKLIVYFSDEVKLGAKAHRTLSSIARNFVKFVHWADLEGHAGFLSDVDKAALAIKCYVEHLREKLQRNKIALSTAVRYQNVAVETLTEFLCAANIVRGVRLIRMKNSDTQSAVPPDEDRVGKALSLCHSLFKGICELVLNKRQYPLQCAMPAYLGFRDNLAWILPSRMPFLAPHLEEGRQTLPKPHWLWNYTDGQVAKLSDIEHKYRSRQYALAGINAAEKALQEANSSAQHKYRRIHAMLAYGAFIHMFIANTAMNLAEVCKLPWEGSYEASPDRQGFRTIKLRAEGRTVSFSIQAVFLPVFKKFIELRTYLLNNRQWKYLFFSRLEDLDSAPTRMRPLMFQDFNKTLRRFDPSFPGIGAREWRVARADFGLRHEGADRTAVALQNKRATVLKNYTGVSETKVIDELGAFYNLLSSVVLETRDNIPTDAIIGPLGMCKQFDSPAAYERDVPIEPDCHQAEGCLFCNKFAVHADAIDIRKLLSCRYCIMSTIHLADNDEHFNKLFGEVLTRIDNLLKTIESLNPSCSALIEKIRTEVNEEELLDPYWAKKIEMLISIEVLI